MPNQPRPDNPARTVRIDDEEWEPVVKFAAEDKVPKSEIVRQAIRLYVSRRKNGEG